MVGIRDIAKKAGVSISTVSYALNGSHKVTEKTREHIIKIAEDLQYVPNMAARTLKTKETGIIGFYIPGYRGEFYGALFEGVLAELNSSGYELVICRGQRSQLFLPEKLIDGAIILDPSFPEEKILENANKGFKIVLLDREIEHPNIRTVLLDNRGGATLAIDYLKEQMTSKLYLITGPEDTYDSQQRLAVATKELSRFNHLPFEIVQGDFSVASGRVAAQHIIKNYQGEHVSVFSLNDDMAVGMYKEFEENNFRIPLDVSIVGFDNIEIASYLTPGLTTVHYSKEKWGALAARKLVNLLRGKKTESEKIYTTLLERGSVLKT